MIVKALVALNFIAYLVGTIWTDGSHPEGWALAAYLTWTLITMASVAWALMRRP